MAVGGGGDGGGWVGGMCRGERLSEASGMPSCVVTRHLLTFL